MDRATETIRNNSNSAGSRTGTGGLGRLLPAVPSFPGKLLVGLARLYQKTIGVVLPNACRFTPTCSQYFIEAVKRHGALRGSWLGFKRLLRCNQFFRGGHDPVP